MGLEAAQRKRGAQIEQNEEELAAFAGSKSGRKMAALVVINDQLKLMYERVARDITRNKEFIEEQSSHLAAEMHCNSVLLQNMTAAMGGEDDTL